MNFVTTSAGDTILVDVKWGPTGYLVYKRTYARPKDDGTTEEFNETVDRVIVACRDQLKVGFSQDEENRLKDYFYKMKGSVAGRFWWQLGTTTVNKLGLFSLQNCAAVVVNDPIKPFVWAFDALMLGSGVGYNIQTENVYELPRPKTCKITRKDTHDADFIVPDSREGWVALLERVLTAHFKTGKDFSYSTVCIRGKGAPIKGFGGTASGPEELCKGMEDISKILNKRAKKKLNPTDCLDIMNIIGAIVVAGNVRRSAQIAIGDMNDLQFLKAKDWSSGAVPNWRAMSNNTVICNDIDKLPQQFWDGYEGGGEPYGLFNAKLAQNCGRTGETRYADPGVRTTNPCVTGDTEILTRGGYTRIDGLVGVQTQIWNGFEWSTVTPKITGRDQRLVKVTLSDGRSVTCTEKHVFHIAEGYTGCSYKVEAACLEVGMKLIKHDYPVMVDGVCYPDAYTQGFISADGMDAYDHLWLYEPKFVCASRLNGKRMGKIHYNLNGTGKQAIKLNFTALSKTFVPHDGDLKSRLDWLAGLIDGDGTELKEGGSQIGSVNKKFLLDTQKMLTTLGVQSKVTQASVAGLRSMPDGNGGSADYMCQTAWRLLIGSTQIQHLKELGMQCARVGFNKSPQRDASQFVRVVSTEYAGVADTVYCFNEPLRHLGCFNGIVTGQCGEQPLETFETCCLAELFLPNIKSKSELLDIAKLLYRVCKHSLALPCHQTQTEKVVHRNMRMGIGVTGYAQATEEQLSWLDDTYKELRKFDVLYSSVNSFSPSIKLTTIKPSGTLSLLAGVTPGCHPGFSQYYIRRIRMASNLPLVDTCRKNGYPVEYQKQFDGSLDHNTVVVSFPCSHPEGTVLTKDVTAVKQLETVKHLQAVWSDNAVSCTVYYKKEELTEIKEWLKLNYNDHIKTCSFLLHTGHGFEQAPLEEINRERYEKMLSDCTPISNLNIGEDFDLQECVGGACPIK